MILCKKAADLTNLLKTISDAQTPIGFVPTMGALHEGHLELLKQSKAATGFTVASIFVNPTQFNDPADFAKYPVTIDKDILALELAGCDLLFLPSVADVYPNGTVPVKPFDLGRLDQLLEGAFRPGHFQGVAQVMQRLLELVMPDKLFMGRKDYQQCMVIARLIAQNKWPIELCMIDTVREPSGLAMSSRNMRLSEAGKEAATAIHRALQSLRAGLRPGPLEPMLLSGRELLEQAGFGKIDYLAIADAQTLEPVESWDGRQKLVALAAAFLEGVRLIDNMTLS